MVLQIVFLLIRIIYRSFINASGDNTPTKSGES